MRRIRDVASRSVAHIKRGDTVTIKTTAGEIVRGDRSTGADRLLRFLALLDSITQTELADRAKAAAAPGTRPPTLVAVIEPAPSSGEVAAE